MTTLREQVLQFHKACKHPIGKSPHVPVDDRVRLRARLIAEEFFETLEALFAQSSTEGNTSLRVAREMVESAIFRAPVRVDLVALSDGLADLDYVVEGTRIELGINGEPIAAEVHRSNMAKLVRCESCGGAGSIHVTMGQCRECDGTGLVSLKREDGKTTKPPGWSPPDVAGELKKQAV
jgi:predicted HAD superfamily Cof-like phosphohydrolase